MKCPLDKGRKRKPIQKIGYRVLTQSDMNQLGQHVQFLERLLSEMKYTGVIKLGLIQDFVD